MVATSITLVLEVAMEGMEMGPDTRQRPQRSYGNLFGISPSGNLGPTSLGVDPSQFTPPCSQMQITTISLGKYASSSPARGNLHGSPLEKATIVAQINQRRACGNTANSTTQFHESATQHLQGYHNEGTMGSQPDTYSHVQSSCRYSYPSSNHSYWRQQMSGGRVSGTSINNHLAHPIHSTINSPPSHFFMAFGDKHESSSLLHDPADWDPNYTDELLLQEDSYDVSSLSLGMSNDMRLGNMMDHATLTSGVIRLGHIANQASTSSSSRFLNQRIDGQFQALPT